MYISLSLTIYLWKYAHMCKLRALDLAAACHARRYHWVQRLHVTPGPAKHSGEMQITWKPREAQEGESHASAEPCHALPHHVRTGPGRLVNGRLSDSLS